MKELKWLLFMLFPVCIGFLSSCDKEDSVDMYIHTDKQTIEFPASGGVNNLNIYSNSSWRIVSTTYINNKLSVLEPLTISLKSDSGDRNISLRMEPNKFIYDININLELKIDGQSVIVNIHQSGNPNGIDENGNSSGTGGENQSGIKIPTNVKAVKEGNTIVVTWDVVQGASRYEVFHASSANGNYSSYGYWTQNRYVDKVVLTENNYYKIKAIGSTSSEFSDYAYCNFSSGGSSDSTTPLTPTGLHAVKEGQTIVVSWNAVQNAYYYRLYYRTPLGTEDFINIYAPSTSAVFDRYMKEGTYTFWIQALNSDYKESAVSSKITCLFSSNGGGSGETKKLNAPKNVKAYSGGSFVQISFDQVPLAYQYELYRSSSASSGYRKIIASGGSSGSNSYILTDQNPISGISYYKVKATALSYLGIDDSDYSSYVKVTR